jgi:xanthine dehydrogenase accessory factor
MTPLQLIAAWQQQSHGCERWCVASIVATQGSVPRHAGAWMVIGLDQQGKVVTVGSVGGGAAEAHVIEEALALLVNESTHTQVLTVSLGAGGSAGQTALDPQYGVCGGRMRLVLKMFRRDALDARLADIVLKLNSTRAVIVSAESLLPTIAHAPDCLHFASKPHCWVGGAGHCGVALARTLLDLGFPVSVIDVRAEITGPKLDARAARHLDWQQVLGPTYGEQQIVLLLSRNMDEDLFALDRLHSRYETNHSALAWIGMMGSKRRARLVYQSRAYGKHFLEKIITPIGFDIGAETPEEIAIAIAAQVIQRTRTPQPLSSSGIVF